MTGTTASHALAAAAGATAMALLVAVAHLVARYGAGQAIAGGFWLFLAGTVLAGLRATYRPSRRDEWDGIATHEAAARALQKGES